MLPLELGRSSPVAVGRFRRPSFGLAIAYLIASGAPPDRANPVMTDKLLPPPEPDHTGRTTSDAGGQRWQWDQAEPDAGATVARYIAALRRYKFLVAAVALIGMVMGFFVARRQPREYAAAATIWSPTKQDAGDALGPIRAHELLEASSWLDLVKAPAILDQVVIEQHLYVQAIARDAPNFAGLTLVGSVRPGAYTFKVDEAGSRYTLYLNKQVAEEGTLGDTVGRSSGFRWVPPQVLQRAKVTTQFGLLAPRDAATFPRAAAVGGAGRAEQLHAHVAHQPRSAAGRADAQLDRPPLHRHGRRPQAP